MRSSFDCRSLRLQADDFGRSPAGAPVDCRTITCVFAERQCIITFGPHSPGQAVAMKRMGVEGIYLVGWATSARSAGR